MPITLPTPTEMADAPWHARDKAIGRARTLVASYSRITVPAKPVQRTRLTDEAKAERRASYGAAVREEAAALLAAATARAAMAATSLARAVTAGASK